MTCLLSRLPGKVIVFGLSKEICTRIIIEHGDNARILQSGKLVRHGFWIHTPYCSLAARTPIGASELNPNLRNSQYSTVKQLLCPDIIYLKEDFERIKNRIVIISELSDIGWSKEIDLLPKRLILNQNPASLKLRKHFRHLFQVKWPDGLRHVFMQFYWVMYNESYHMTHINWLVWNRFGFELSRVMLLQFSIWTVLH